MFRKKIAEQVEPPVWYDDAEVVSVSWISISDVVQRLWPRRDSVPPAEDIRCATRIGPEAGACQSWTPR